MNAFMFVLFFEMFTSSRIRLDLECVMKVMGHIDCKMPFHYTLSSSFHLSYFPVKVVRESQEQLYS